MQYHPNHVLGETRYPQALGATDREQLRQDILRSCAVAIGLVSLVLRWWLFAQANVDLMLLLLLTGLLGAALLSYFVATQSVGTAGAVLVLSTATVIVSANRLGAGADGAMGFFLALPLLMAGGVFGPGSLPIATPAAILVVHFALPPAASRGGTEFAIALIGVLGWLCLHPVYQRLDWARESSSQATALAERLRDQKAKLGLTVKALELSNHLLQRTNYELTVAEQEANEARASKEQFTATISHELRAPLNIILGFADIMHHSPEVYGAVNWTPTLRRDIGEIYRNARYLSEFADDIVDLAATEKPRLLLRREPTDIAAVIEEVVPLAQALLHDKPVVLSLALQAGLPRPLIDRMRIRQVLLNLLTNAIRFTEKGQIEIRAHQSDEDTIELAVADSGPGIPADELGAIFDEFYQVAGTRSAPGGKGLGLAIAKHLVQLHGGRIWAESTVGQGATFYISLPIGGKDFSRSVRTPLPALPRRPYDPSAVVLDGSGQADTMLAEALEGWKLVQAQSPEELPALVEELHPDALLVNEAASGAQAANALAREFPYVPVLAWEFLSDTGVAEAGLVQAVLTKPIAAEELLATLERILPPGARHILLVDDDRSFVQLIQRMLQARGRSYQVRCAYTGADGLRRATERTPDGIILDLKLPDMNGIAVARAMRGTPELADIPILLVTAAALPTKPSDEGMPTASVAAFQVLKGQGLSHVELTNLVMNTLQVVQADYVRGGRQRLRQAMKSA
ncbi:MAG: hybrid sensor histidine kinase/response regulator [Anaerolineae bacterium]